MKVVFRADASRSIGTGHIMRCLALAEALRDRDVDVSFVSRDQPGNLVSHLRQRGFAVSVLPREAETVASRTDDGTYLGWLGVSQKEDERQTAKALGGQSPDWLVVDHYAIDAEWEHGVRSCTDRLLVIDDLANRKHECEVLIDQNYVHHGDARYAGLVSPNTLLLLGPFYALMRPEYHALREQTSRTRESASRVLIYYGGTDASNETSRALRVLSRPQFRHIAVDVVVSSNNPHAAELETLASQRPLTELHGSLPQLSHLMAKADLALGAAGITTWERCAAGLPSVVTAVAENQRVVAEPLAEDGVVRYIGMATDVDDGDVADAIEKLLDDPSSLRAMAGKAARITDGLGAQRVAETLVPTASDLLSLRPANEYDKGLYFHWTNDRSVRQNSFQSEEIDWETHDKWFDDHLADPNCLMWVMETPHEVPVGQVRIDLAKDADVLSFSVDPAFRRRGWGTRILELAAVAWRQLRRPTELVGSVMDKNIASQQAFRRAGFVEDHRDMRDRRFRLQLH